VYANFARACGPFERLTTCDINVVRLDPAFSTLIKIIFFPAGAHNGRQQYLRESPGCRPQHHTWHRALPSPRPFASPLSLPHKSQVPCMLPPLSQTGESGRAGVKRERLVLVACHRAIPSPLEFVRSPDLSSGSVGSGSRTGRPEIFRSIMRSLIGTGDGSTVRESGRRDIRNLMPIRCRNFLNGTQFLMKQ